MTRGKKVLIMIAVILLGFVVSLITNNGIYFFLCLLAVVIAGVVFAARWVKGKRLVDALGVEPQRGETPAKYRFAVAGVYYRKDVLMAAADRHKDFGLADEEFIARHQDGRPVYEFKLKRSSKVELIPEPTNEHDPDAIAVYVDGAHVGYVPASETGEVRQLLAAPCSIRGWIAGGARKKVVNGRVVTEASDLNMYVEIEREA